MKHHYPKIYRRCNQVLEFVPKDYERRGALEEELKELCEAARYSAPETNRIWERLREILQYYLPKPDTVEWAATINQIISERDNYDPYPRVWI